MALVETRKFVTKTKVHTKLSQQFVGKHPRQVFPAGDKVCIKGTRKVMDRYYSKLDIVWKGPAESLQGLGVGRYKIAPENIQWT